MTDPAALLPDFALASEVQALRREVRELRSIVGQLSRRRGAADGRLGEVLRLIHAFAFSTPWTAGEILADSARADRDLWAVLDTIVGRGDPPIRLGRWLQRHEGIAVDGLRLTRIKAERGVWLYAVERELQELTPA